MQGNFWGRVACVAALALVPVRATAVILSGSDAVGAPDTQVSIAVTLATEGAAVLATQNRIDFDRTVFVAPRANGQPDCTVEPAIDKSATAFRYTPLGCDPLADCTGVRAFVLAFDNLDPIADGAVLYHCTLAIAAHAAPGEYELTLTDLGASAAMGVLLPISSESTVVTVTTPPVARLIVGDATGVAGSTVTVNVGFTDLAAGSVPVVGVQHDLALPPGTTIPADTGGAPACTVNPAIDKDGTVFTFLPDGCTPGSNCSAVRAFVLSLMDAEPLADGTMLYSCPLHIAANAVPGTYPLAASMVRGSGPLGESRVLAAVNGSLTIEPAPACAGDCDGGGSVSINELLLGVNIIIGLADTQVCPALDVNGNGEVTIDELVRAVNVALGGCET